MLEIILVQGFCPLKIKITQFPDRFCLKLTCLYRRKVVLPFVPEVYEVNKSNIEAPRGSSKVSWDRLGKR